ncbi:complement factor B-like isoform X2 [Colossoma macropomum]|uniref:complement factor B-like isoform X2 n=1 Tax=Colossoma macropomum TaxID=42526 RepID=UPI00186485C0|nr:complement factor B-like isoform X2 [Colossoma macropomum]
MESVLCCYLLFFVMIGLCPLLIGAELKCSDSNLSITGGTFTLSNNYDEDSILMYRCPQGYYPYPVKMRQCSKGKWHPVPTRRRSECKKITCPNPHVMDNGDVEPYKTLYYVNDTTTYRCHSDYTFRGSPTRVCQLNGKWSGITPICSRDSDFTYDTPAEVAEAFGSTLKTLIPHKENGKISLDQKGKLNIYIALDASVSTEEEDFDRAKEIIIKLIDKISYYEVSPNYEIIIFATEVTRIVSITDYKREDEKKLYKIIKTLNNYKYDEKGQKSGTNIAKAYKTILDSMSFEKTSNITAFSETHHVIIMFTDGMYTMGGNPAHTVNEIKQLVYNGDELKQDEFLDLYAFGVGEDVQKEDIDDWVSKRPNEKHFFLFRNMKELQRTFDEMIDQSIDRFPCRLCGLYRDYDDNSDETRRRRYPWLIQFYVTRKDGKASNCLGSLVSPSFILTAAHCFKFEDVLDNIKLETPTGKNLQPLKAKNLIIHPKYEPRGEMEGTLEYYENDVALIELENGIEADASLRPVCIPCTKETSVALRLPGRDVTCAKHKEELLSGDLVDAFFMSSKPKQGILPKNNVKIKQGHKRDACIEDAKKALNISNEKARLLITDNFLCTGGLEQNHMDEVSCKADSGGATFVQQRFRAFQVGVVSWGLKDLCTGSISYDELETVKDFHIDLFNPEVQVFLKTYLGDKERGTSLTFLKR